MIQLIRGIANYPDYYSRNEAVSVIAFFLTRQKEIFTRAERMALCACVHDRNMIYTVKSISVLSY